MDIQNVMTNNDLTHCVICGSKLPIVGDVDSCPNKCYEPAEEV